MRHFFLSPFSPAARKPVFQGFWHGPPLGALRKACLRTFLEKGYVFELYTYDHVDAPDGVIIRRAEAVIPKDDLFYYKNPETGKPDLGPFSDLFRFKLLLERGGWWIDVDTICLSDSIPNIRHAWAQQLPELNASAIGTGQIAFPANDPIVKELFRRCNALSRTAFSPREALGPHLISQVVSDLRLPQNRFGTADTFYPLRFIEMFKLWLPEFREEVHAKLAHAMFLPIFQSFPSYIGIDMEALPPLGSYLGELSYSRESSSNDLPRHCPERIRKATFDYFSRNADWAIPELSSVSRTKFQTLDEFGEHLGLFC